MSTYTSTYIAAVVQIAASHKNAGMGFAIAARRSRAYGGCRAAPTCSMCYFEEECNSN